MRTRQPAARGCLLLVGALTVSGCACDPNVSLAPPAHITVLELPPTPSARSLVRVLHHKPATADQAFLTAAHERIERELDADLRSALPSRAEAPGIGITPLEQPRMTIGRPLESAALVELRSSQPADTYLRVRVTDYGETPRRWEAAYIGFEVLSTAAIAGALYVHKVTRPLAAAYLAEETVEEIGEGYAGFWVLNRLSRPVRIEADMVDGHSGQVLWHTAHTGLSRWRWRNVRHMDDVARDALLDTSMRKAVAKLAKGVEKLEAASAQPPAGP